jgi:hypothetical protein
LLFKVSNDFQTKIYQNEARSRMEHLAAVIISIFKHHNKMIPSSHFFQELKK